MAATLGKPAGQRNVTKAQAVRDNADEVSMMHDFLIPASVLVAAMSPRLAAALLLGNARPNCKPEPATPVPLVLRAHMSTPLSQA
jgi:hypothetical protein